MTASATGNPNDPGSAELLRRAFSGDEEALSALLTAMIPSLKARFAAKVPARWRAVLAIDDLIQETFTDAFLNFAGFTSTEPAGFERWLTAIANNNLINALRMLEADKRGGARRAIAPASDESYFELLQNLGGTATTPSSAAARAESRDVLAAALKRLPPVYRMVIQLYDLEGAGITNVSAALGRAPGAVFMLRARAHRALQRLLGGAEDFLSGEV